MDFDLIMGKQTVREALLYKPSHFLKVYVARHKEKEKDPLLLLLEKKKIPIVFVSKEELYSMVQSDSHQSFVAKIKKRKMWDLRSFLQEKESSFLVLLDSILDPQNLGAILRSAECFSVDGVIVSKNRGAPLTATVAKASCGASELLDLIEVSNLAESLRVLQEYGFESIVSEASREGAKSLSGFSFPKKSVLVMGSEEQGVQDLICKRADHLVYIPMGGKIASLNVAQASSIFLAEQFMQRAR
jgi:23S rRNA (guanosine2251-2'-O)-methyltransferase